MSEADDATLPASTLPRSVSSAAATDIGERYALGALLGRGGMGEVRLAHDTRIRREVAVKLMRASTDDESASARFVREARIQGVLEHPAIVPVHDLGVDDRGSPYFVMKRLAGTTLADVLAHPDPARWPRRQLLARLVDVCLATEFAHTRGVIHRDLKPANIMLGDFGEAYVLDWGLARSNEEPATSASAPAVALDAAHTVAGAMLGTPGYMSPEQARGDAVDARTDVFSLGCVLYEILAGQPALPRGMAAIEATLEAACHRPSAVALDVPPELDELCALATAADARSRPSARRLGDGIQAYLDGDRDLVRRCELAGEHARRASEAMAQGDDGRALAMREAGQALVLDPSNVAAQAVVFELLEAPQSIPVEALASAEEERSRSRRTVAHWGAYGYLALVGFVVVLLALPVHRRDIVLATLAISSAAWLALRWIGHRLTPSRARVHIAVFVLTGAMIACSGVMFGPLLITPAFVIAATAGYLWVPHGHHVGTVITSFVLPYVLLVLLEINGVLPPTMRFVDGSLVLTSPVISLTPGTTSLLVGMSMVIQVTLTALIAINGRRRAERDQNRVHAQRWHLRKMLPEVGRSS